MKNLHTFEAFLKDYRLNENIGLSTKTREIEISFDIDWNENIGKVKKTITLAMSPKSTDIYSIGDDIEKYTGLPEKDAKEYKETPEDAFIYGMCNVMNGGADTYFWTNGTRLSGAVKKSGLWPAIMEQISHECLHLTRSILSEHISKKKGSKDWVNDPWPSVGDDPKVNLIDEEAFATAHGLVVQTVTPHFLEMASDYIPELKLILKK